MEKPKNEICRREKKDHRECKFISNNSKHPITRFLTSMELSFALTVSGEYINSDGKLHVI